MSELNIYQRLNKVREEVAYLQKDAKVQGYKAVTHDAVTSAVREPFIKNGIMVIPNQVKSETHDVGQTSNGTTIIRYEATYEVRFVNIDKPEENFVSTVESHAMDHGDKAPGKAMSYAVKYAMLKVLNIETGESEESRIEVQKKKEESQKLTPDSDRWRAAVQAIASGNTTIEKVKKKIELSPEHEEQLKSEAMELV